MNLLCTRSPVHAQLTHRASETIQARACPKKSNKKGGGINTPPNKHCPHIYRWRLLLLTPERIGLAQEEGMGVNISPDIYVSR